MDTGTLYEKSLKQIEDCLTDLETNIPESKIKEFLNNAAFNKSAKDKTKQLKKIKAIKRKQNVKKSEICSLLYKMAEKEIKGIKSIIPYLNESTEEYMAKEKELLLLQNRIDEENDMIKEKQELTERAIKKKKDLIDQLKKEVAEEKRKSEITRKDLQKKLETYHSEMMEKVRKFTREKEENKRISERLESVDTDIEVQKKKYMNDFENKRKEINERKDKVNESINNIQSEIEKIPEYEKEEEGISKELDEVTKVDNLLENQYSCLSEKMETCDTFFQDMKINMSKIHKMMKTIENSIDNLEKGNEKSTENLLGEIKKNLLKRKKIEKFGEQIKKFDLMKTDLETKISQVGEGE